MTNECSKESMENKDIPVDPDARVEAAQVQRDYEKLGAFLKEKNDEMEKNLDAILALLDDDTRALVEKQVAEEMKKADPS